jgi:hypothetical protein
MYLSKKLDDFWVYSSARMEECKDRKMDKIA